MFKVESPTLSVTDCIDKFNIAFLTAAILTSKGGNINNGSIPFRCANAKALVLYMLAHWHGILVHLNRTEPSLILLVSPMLFPL